MVPRKQRSVRTLSSTLSVALAAFFSAGEARAGDRELADRLFEDALVLSDAGDWDGACPKFKQSYEAEASVGALLNMASCSERVGDLLLAKQQYAEAAEHNESTADPVRRDAVKQQLEGAVAALDLRIPRVEVSAKPAAARIFIDGKPATAEATGNAVAVGKHSLRVQADGFVSQERALELVEKQRLRLEVALVPLPAEKPKLALPREANGGSSLLVPGLVVSGLGLAIVGAGGALLGVASAKASEIADLCGDDPEPPACFGSAAQAAEATELSNSGRPMEIAGGVLVGVGGAALVTGVVLIALGGGRSDESLPGVSLAPVIAPDALGFRFGGRF